MMARSIQALLFFSALVMLLVSCAGDSRDPERPPVGQKPDLIVRSLTWAPDVPHPGQRITVTVSVGSLDDSVRMATRTRLIVDGGESCGQLVTPPVPEGGTVRVTCSIDSLPAGAHELRACADATRFVAESDEENNCRLETLAVAPPAR